MKKRLKIFLFISIALFASLTIGLIFSRYMVLKSLPSYSDQIETQNIKNNVRLYRDNYGIAYIAAATESDAAFALGYAHAQERLFQMDIMRRLGEGRLSEVFGGETAQYDMLFRSFEFEKISKEITSKLPYEDLNILTSYSEGVNLFIERANNNYALEFDLLGYTPELWEPKHSVLIAKLLGWELNIAFWADFAFADLISKFDKEKILDIIPAFSENAPIVISEKNTSNLKIDQKFIELNKKTRDYFNIRGTHIGSNNWVVSPQKSVSGKPIIANDPHLAYSAPGKWYFAAIKGGDWEAAGATIPGVPTIVIGKNKNIAWTMTNVMADEADFYFEKLNNEGTKYLVENEWKELAIIYDTIKIKNDSNAILRLKKTHRGPIISSFHLYRIWTENESDNNEALSMKWTGSDPTFEISAFRKINKAGDWKEFNDAVKDFSLPSQNFVYADAEGNIGYVYGGKLPIRFAPSPFFVYDGTESKNDWKGYVPFDELPKIFNPPQNYIATANNKTVLNYPHYISNLWEPSSRIERIKELLEAKEKHSVDDFKNYQNDIVSPYAAEVVAFLLDAFENCEIEDHNLKVALDLLRKWDFSFNSLSQTPAIYSVFFQFLLKNIFLDEMGETLFYEYVFLANIPYRTTLSMLQKNQSKWFDNIETDETEDRNFILRKSLTDALNYLEKKYGEDIKSWQWGCMHKTSFRHIFSGRNKIIDKYFNISALSIGGDGTTVFNTEYSFNEPFENILGPSMRFIFDFAEPDEIHFISNTGQSGHVFSEHYSDMNGLWVKGEYIKIKTDFGTIEKSKFNKIDFIKINKKRENESN